MQGPILVVNAGSSSIKFSGYAVNGPAGTDPAPQRADRGHRPGAAHDRQGRERRDDRREDLAARRQIGSRGPVRLPDRLDHRRILAVEHPSPSDIASCMAVPLSPRRRASTTRCWPRLQSLCPLAPLHQPHNLAAIRAIAAVAPSLPQVACFDTAFHHDQPPVAQRFALPRELHDAGIRRYGFHGLSYDYIASALRERAPDVARGRVVVAHLGSGASLCAMRDGKSIDTTMGFTALDGLPMGTRCGALDPGVILYLLRERGMNADAIEKLLYHQCGLLGVSGISSDMRELLASDDRSRQGSGRPVCLSHRP